VRALESVIGTDPAGLDRAVALLKKGVGAASKEGHPMFTALQALPWPGTQLGDLWRACDMVREHRGDSHVNAWVSMGLHPVEINVLSELWRGVPLGSVTMMQMGWSRDDVAAALAGLSVRGLVAERELTPDGRRLREEIETNTDGQERSLVEPLGNDADELLELLDPWARAIATNYIKT
jgi:hypothetical protein